MLFFGVCFFLYFIKLSAGKGFLSLKCFIICLFITGGEPGKRCVNNLVFCIDTVSGIPHPRLVRDSLEF